MSQGSYPTTSSSCSRLVVPSFVCMPDAQLLDLDAFVEVRLLHLGAFQEFNSLIWMHLWSSGPSFGCISVTPSFECISGGRLLDFDATHAP